MKCPRPCRRLAAWSVAALLALLPPMLPARDLDLPDSPTTVPAEPPITVTPAGTYTNPLGVSLADPDVLLHEGVYYLYATSLTNLGYCVWTSKDLVNWQLHDELALARDHLSWGNSNFWAPDAIGHNGKFYLFYNCVGPAAVGKMAHRICLAVADHPLGPFKEIKGPFLDFGRAVIDPNVFIDEDGKAYLYFSLDHSENWKQGGLRASELYVIELSADLMNIVGEPKMLFGATQQWEGRPDLEDTWNEAPFVFKHNGVYVMTYSARVFSDPLYAVGYATAASPWGPWNKAEENPILKLNSKVSGPGHNSVIPSPDGSELFVVYHSHRDPEGGYRRELNIDRMIISDLPDGVVKLKILGPTRTPQRLPSGARAQPTSTRPVTATFRSAEPRRRPRGER